MRRKWNIMKVSRVRKAWVSRLEEYGRVTWKNKIKNRCQSDIGYFGDPQNVRKINWTVCPRTSITENQTRNAPFQTLYVIIATELKTWRTRNSKIVTLSSSQLSLSRHFETWLYGLEIGVQDAFHRQGLI